MLFSVFNYTFNGTLLPTGEATFQHPAWTQSSGLGAASACDSFSRPCLLGPFLSDRPPVAGAQGQSSLCVSMPQFPPLPALRMHIFTTHTNTQRSIGWSSPAPWLAMKRWLIVAEGWSSIYYLFTFRVIPSGGRRSTNKLSSCRTAVQNRTWIIVLETWEAPAGLCALNKYRQASEQHIRCHVYPLWPANEDCPRF